MASSLYYAHQRPHRVHPHTHAESMNYSPPYNVLSNDSHQIRRELAASILDNSHVSSHSRYHPDAVR